MFTLLSLEKKRCLSYITIFVGLNIANFAHADYPSQNKSSSYENKTDANEYRTASVTDPDLAKKIKDKIGSGWFSEGYDKVSVQVNNGAVLLQGSVKTWDDKEKVEKEVRNIEGVKSLNSQITVLDLTSKDKPVKQFPQDRYATSADNQLNKKIRDHVSKGWVWDSYKDVSLNTTNGVVTLEGVVDSMDDQQKLVNEIQKIDGVKGVNSDLRFNNR